MKTLSLALLCASAFAQTAVYPGAVATDSQLKVALNGTTTLLTGTINNAQTNLTVSACAGLTANVLITIDSEIMPVATCSGTALVVSSRGYDGTPAAAHGANSQIGAFIDAWHHNSMAREVEAIEASATGIGVNVKAFGAVGNGTNDDTSAINAAIASATSGGTIGFPAGTYKTSSPIVEALSNITLQCAGQGLCVIQPSTPNFDVIQIGNNSSQIFHVAINGITINGPPTTASSGYGVNVRFSEYVDLNNVNIFGGASGGLLPGPARTLWRGVHFSDCFFCRYIGGTVNATVDQGIRTEGTTGSGRGSGDVNLIGKPTISQTGSDATFIGDHVGGYYSFGLEVYGVQNAWAINIGPTTGTCCIHIYDGDLSNNEGDTSVTAGAINVNNFGGTVNVWGTNIFGSGNAANPKPAIAIASPSELMTNGLSYVGATQTVVDNSGILEMTGGTLNGSGTATGGAVIAEASSLGTSITGVKFYQWGASANAIVNNMTAQNVNVCGNSFVPAMFQAWLPSSSYLTACPNGGVDSVNYTLASAASMFPGTSPVLFVSGTTAISSINNTWTGRKLDLIFTDAAPGGLLHSTGNVANTVSVSQYQKVSCYYSVPLVLGVSGATNASPIVISTASAHGIPADGTPVVISGVLGNTAANGSYFAKISTYTATTFGLYSNVGVTTPVAGSGSYTSGGALTYGGNQWYCK